MTKVRTSTRSVALLAGGALLLTGALVAPLGALPVAQGADLTTSYRMTITNEPANTYGGVNYNYLTYPGFDLFMYNNGYNGTFGDEHLSGITLTLHGQRIAGNGDIHLLPVPEQWDAAAPASSAPVAANARQYDYTTNTITLPMRYRYDYAGATTYRDMRYDLISTPEPGGVVVKVVLQDDLPSELAGSAAFNLEFIPSLYMNKSYQVDTDGNGSYDTFSTLPLAPEDPMDEQWPRPQLAGNAWYVDQWNTEKGDAQPSPLARGYRFNLAPEDNQTHISVRSTNLLSIYDGRNRSQNGWFTMSSKIDTGAKAGATVAEWHIQAPVERDWVREPSIAHSQAGYGTGLTKVAVMEIDKNDTSAPNTAALGRLEADGSVTPVFTDTLAPAVRWTRYTYRSFDFSSVTTPGIYVLEYDGVRTDVFPIDDNVYDKTWQPALSGYLATAMDHIELREGYKIWHGASHMDDARIGESFQNSVVDPGTNRIPWFDGQQVPMTLPAVVQAKGYALGDRIPGLDQGGWYDAGDFDIQLASNQSVLRNLINNAETFDNLDDYDTLAVEWSQDSGGSAEMHRPDGVPDVVQQVKHGAMQILANYENVGIVQGTIEVPTLRQYTHLGDGSTDTDGYIYDPALGENEVVERGGKVYSGVNDDRMLMFGAGAGAATSNLGTVSINLAGAAAVVKQYYPDFAADCLAAAREIWTAHGAWAMGTAAQRSNAFNTLVQLMLATQGTADYAAYKADMDYLLGLNATSNPNPFATFLPIQSNVAATFIADLMGPAYTANLIEAAETLAAGNTFNYVAGTPFGFTESLTSGWGPSSGRYSTAATGAFILKNLGSFTGSEKIEEAIIRSVNYIMGTHPYNDTSWLTGVGANSHKMPYNSNRADNGYIPGSLVPGYVSFRPDFPESLDNFQFLWAENEATIGGVSSWIAPAKMAAEIAAGAVASTPPVAAADFHGSFMMEAQETQAVNPYTGAAETPYETLTTPGFDVFMY
ncbi:MAG: glycoside hydrolase family 9 protein, partial [Bifidobacteriaceae bacterium]|nr:glycoside hydrolase family 9 protein [Bifidobacteriaceae bacterium]